MYMFMYNTNININIFVYIHIYLYIYVSDNLLKKTGRGRPPKSASPIKVAKPPLLSTSHLDKKDLKRKEMDTETLTDTPLRKDVKLAAVSSLPSARCSVSASASASVVMSTDRRSSSRLSVPEAKETVKGGAKKDTKGANSSHPLKAIGRPPRTAAVAAAASIRNNSKL
jgi:hypothetical protein